MKNLCFLVHLLVGLCFRSYSAFPPQDYTQHASIQSPRITGSSQHTRQEKAPAEEQEQVNAVRVTCHPDSLEIIIKMTEDTLVYTNLLVYSPVASPDGVVRMDEAVIPIAWHYERKYSLSSSSLMPTWIPFMATQAAVETLEFDLSIMTNDWLYRNSNVFYLGEPIGIQASVRVGHHAGLRVFVSSCVATLYPDVASEPRYVFKIHLGIEGKISHFWKNRIGEVWLYFNLYITCHLNAVLANDAEAPNKACSFENDRWRSANGNDYLCGYCQSHDEPSSPGKFGPCGGISWPMSSILELLLRFAKLNLRLLTMVSALPSY
uniref:Zona pellucida sperm-binding protein 3 n=1 Tax=Cyclopterus lumpus TaxID=8103 RepID=A0A8C2YYN1_CYCLU